MTLLGNKAITEIEQLQLQADTDKLINSSDGKYNVMFISAMNIMVTEWLHPAFWLCNLQGFIRERVSQVLQKF